MFRSLVEPRERCHYSAPSCDPSQVRLRNVRVYKFIGRPSIGRAGKHTLSCAGDYLCILESIAGAPFDARRESLFSGIETAQESRQSSAVSLLSVALFVKLCCIMLTTVRAL